MADPELRKLSYYFTSSKRKGREGLPLMSVTMHNGLVRREDLERDKERKTKSSLEAEEHLLVEPGDIAYNMMRMWQGALGLAAEPANVSPAYGVMRPKPTVDPRFAAHWFKSEYGLYMLWAYSYGLTNDRLRLYPKDFLEIPVRWPDRPSQRRVAAVLDDFDNLVANAEAVVSAKHNRLTWLTDKLVFSANEWACIEDLADQTSERAGSKFENYTVFSCTKHDGLVHSDEYFSRTVYGADRSDYKIVRPLDLAYATNHLEEGSIGLNTFANAGVVSPMYTVFRPHGIDPRYLIAVLKTERLRQEFERRTPASVNRRGGLRWADFAETEIPCPQDAEQKHVLERLETAQKDLQQSQSLLAGLRAQKRGLMKKLLTGEWRVPESIDALLPKAEERAA